MSDFAKDYDEFKCTICGKEYQAVVDRKYCNDCARIVYADIFKNQHSLFGNKNGESKK